MPASKGSPTEAEALAQIGEALGQVFYVEALSDHAGQMASALDSLANATALRTHVGLRT